LDRASL